jgi:hypothetical protein
MTKKHKEPLMVPYVEWIGGKDYLTYPNCDIGEETPELVWHEGAWCKGILKWEPATEFEDTLVLVDTERGQSAARLVVHSVTNGNRYQMFFADFVKMLKQIDMHKGILVGRFIPCKKGSNYAIQWLGKPNE